MIRRIKKWFCLRFLCDIPKEIRTRKDLMFGYPFGIVIGERVQIGKNCVIYHGVTIGQKHGEFPVLKDKVVVYPNATIVGDVTIGSKAKIQANCFVDYDVCPRSVIYNPRSIELFDDKEGDWK